MLFRLIIYVENIENLTYIASTKKPGYLHFKKKKQQQQQQQPAILFHAKLWTFPADFLGADGSR